MATLKNHEADAFLKKAPCPYPVILIFGPDETLVAERCSEFLKVNSRKTPNQDDITKIDSSELSKDRNRLLDEAYSVGLFSDQKTIHVKISDARTIVTSIENILKQPAENTQILLQAGDLKKTSPLRKRIEAAQNAIAIPCYEDVNSNLENKLTEIFKEQNISIDKDSKTYLAEYFRSNKAVLKTECEKIITSTRHKKTVSIEDISGLLNNEITSNLDIVLDHCFTGNTRELEHTLQQAYLEGINVNTILLALNRHLLVMHRIRITTDKYKSVDQAIDSIKPPIFFKNKPLFKRHVMKWSTRLIENSISATQKLSQDLRLKPDIAENLLTAHLQKMAGFASKR
jgi:DNA polymerase-3 subunit delta